MDIFDGTISSLSPVTFVSVFFFGILISFTPCIYPMLPVIIGYMGGTELKSRREGFVRSFCYVAGLAAVYALLGVIAALSGGLFGTIQHSFWVSLLVANVLIVMGLFMLDVFSLPQMSLAAWRIPGITNPYGGAVVLGMVSGLVAGPCTTPVLGGILTYVAVHGTVAGGAALLGVYALGMGVPLIMVGTFVGLLKKMPRSGPWMLRIKKLFGLMLIASGEYFLLGLR